MGGHQSSLATHRSAIVELSGGHAGGHADAWVHVLQIVTVSGCFSSGSRFRPQEGRRRRRQAIYL